VQPFSGKGLRSGRFICNRDLDSQQLLALSSEKLATGKSMILGTR